MKKNIISAILCFIFLFTCVLEKNTYAGSKPNALMFIELEKTDSSRSSLNELAIIWITNINLGRSYKKFYWLVSENATCDNLKTTMISGVKESSALDLYFLCHGQVDTLKGHQGYASDNWIFADSDILPLGDYENMDRLRFVYIGSCMGYTLTDDFLAIGADSAIGNLDGNSNAVFFPAFSLFFQKRNFFNLDISKPLYKAVSRAKLSTIIEGRGIRNFQIEGNRKIKITSP